MAISTTLRSSWDELVKTGNTQELPDGRTAAYIGSPWNVFVPAEQTTMDCVGPWLISERSIAVQGKGNGTADMPAQQFIEGYAALIARKLSAEPQFSANVMITYTVTNGLGFGKIAESVESLPAQHPMRILAGVAYEQQHPQEAALQDRLLAMELNCAVRTQLAAYARGHLLRRS